MKNNFSENLKRLMFEKALTQEDLAKKLKLDQSRISRWKTGENIPSATNLKKLSSIFGISVKELLNTENTGSVKKKDVNAKIDSLEKEINIIKERLINFEKKLSQLIKK